MSHQPSPSTGQGLASLYGDVFSPENLGASLHQILNLVVGVASFSIVVTLLALTLGLILLFPLAILTAWLLWLSVRGLGAMERGRFRLFLDTPIHPPRVPPSQGGILATTRSRMTDAATWRALLYLLVLLPLGTVSFTVTIVVWTLPFGLMVAAVQAVVLGGGDEAALRTVPLATGLLGAALIPFIPYPIRALSHVDKAIGSALLGPSPTEALEDQVTQLATSRSHVVETAEDERRRIERDLHDGAQQRLVSLAMNLGMAREKLDTDMAGAKDLVEEAHLETKRALAELRDLARGIHPAILSERGLESALTPLAALAPVPVALSVEIDERPEPRIETVTYFIVSEALANVSKHARASQASVTIARDNDRLVVEVTDDGQGGADPNGGGLSGLRHRVEAIDGWFTVTSPGGGPTTVMAELPCG